MDKSYIKSTIQGILNKTFTSSEKRRINEYDERFNCACVYCGDSEKHTNMKRLNIYFDKLLVICFNCGKKTSFDRFCKDFSIQMDPDRKMEMINHLNSVVTYRKIEDDILDNKFDKLIDIKEIERIFNNGENVMTDFMPVERGSIIYNYLIKRKIFDFSNIYEATFWNNEERSEPVIAILNRKGNKILGIQVRNIKEGKRRFFKIYNFETLYKWVTGQDEIEDIEIDQLITYNKLSAFFNILNVDFGERVTIFEGYIDSIFYPNSIGLIGTNTSSLDFLENNGLDIQYMYDNDKAGHLKSDEKIKKGYPVFLWKKLFESIVEKKKSEDPYKLMHRIEKVKDLNQLATLVDNPYKKLSLDGFFSKDIYDMKYLPKFYYKKYTK